MGIAFIQRKLMCIASAASSSLRNMATAIKPPKAYSLKQKPNVMLSWSSTLLERWVSQNQLDHYLA